MNFQLPRTKSVMSVLAHLLDQFIARRIRSEQDVIDIVIDIAWSAADSFGTTLFCLPVYCFLLFCFCRCLKIHIKLKQSLWMSLSSPSVMLHPGATPRLRENGSDRQFFGCVLHVWKGRKGGEQGLDIVQSSYEKTMLDISCIQWFCHPVAQCSFVNAKHIANFMYSSCRHHFHLALAAR